jgi:pimeloyl-ACP methyl ester carboxylesterase
MGGPADERCQSTKGPTTFVLIHGAWKGGWSWWMVAAGLRAAGHVVYTPTLTGLGERSHLLRPDITIADHVEDVVKVFEFEELTDVVLVGHSYGGMVIVGAASRIPERVRSLVFVDAIVPKEGETVSDLWAVDTAIHPLPPPAPALVVAEEPLVARVARSMTPHPTGTFTSPAFGTASVGGFRHRTYIHARLFDNPLTANYAAHAASDADWTLKTLDGSHDLMVDCPSELAQALIDVADR